MNHVSIGLLTTELQLLTRTKSLPSNGIDQVLVMKITLYLFRASKDLFWVNLHKEVSNPDSESLGCIRRKMEICMTKRT